MSSVRTRIQLAAGLLATAIIHVPALSAQCPAMTKENMPLKYKGGPTSAAITPCDLMTRLYIYADDSMMGRDAGSPDLIRATAYVESQVKALGLKPGGDNGTFFQYMPVFKRAADSASATMDVGGTKFKFGKDFTVAGDANLAATPVIYGGVRGDTLNPLTADQVQGKVVLVKNPPQGAGGRGGFPGGGAGGRGGRGAGGAAPANPFAGAAAVLTIVGDDLNAGGGGRGGAARLIDSVQIKGAAAYAASRPDAANGRGGRAGGGAGGAAGAPAATITTSVANAILGKSVDQAAKGDVGKSVSFSVQFKDYPAPTRNVIAIQPGTDPKLKNEYVIIGGHSDHVGYTGGGGSCNFRVPHDSLKAYNMIAATEGAERTGRIMPNADQWVRINGIKDSLRKIYPERTDTICNGADDDGSGSVSVLEIAEAFAKGSIKTKRSMIFIWQAGEEKGLWGSSYFTNHPTTMPLDAIIADLNIDMVGRGEATDVTGEDKAGAVLHGASNYVQLVGAARLSTELDSIAEQVNRTEKVPFKFDYSMDADGHSQNIYCRSDHANYARYGIPVIFFTTGGHADYHQATDEPQYIQYQHMARVDQLIFDIAVKVGNADHRVVVDKTKPESPFARCQQ